MIFIASGKSAAGRAEAKMMDYKEAMLWIYQIQYDAYVQRQGTPHT